MKAPPAAEIRTDAATGGGATPNPLRLDARCLLAVAVMLLLWSSAFPASKAALPHYSPGHIALLRYLVASVILIGLAAVKRWPLPRWRDWPLIALMGFLGFTVYNVALNQGQLGVTAGTSSFLVNTAPVFTVILAVLFIGERVRPIAWGGIFVSMVGMALLAMAKKGGLSFNPSALLVLLAAVAASIYTILQKQLLQRYDSLSLVTYAIWWGTLFMLVFAPGLVEEVRRAPLGVTLSIVYMGIFPTVVAYAIWAYVLARLPISMAVSFIYLVPVLAVILSWLWLHETLSARACAGGVLALLGVIIVNTLGKNPPVEKAAGA